MKQKRILIFKNQSTGTHFLLVIALLLLWALMMSPVAFAAGRIEYHRITSKILADAGRVAKRELSVYLPEEYDTSGLAYPVLYLLHGGWWSGCGLICSNRVFFEGQFSIVSSVDKSIGDEKIEPLIIVSPNVAMLNIFPPTKASVLNDRLLVKDYISQEVIPFVDKNYRTIPDRRGRAISGWSNGGLGALFIGLSVPEKFSLVGTYSGGVGLAEGLVFIIERDLVVAHKQGDFPLQFWVYVGIGDDYGFTTPNRKFVNILKEFSLPYEYVEDAGDHFNMIVVRVVESIQFFSERLVGNVAAVHDVGGDEAAAIWPRDKLATTWGEMKQR